MHTSAPELHTMIAVAPQAVVGVQLAPAAHAIQVPVTSHTPLPPVASVHAVPAVADVSTVQTGAPDAQL